MKNPIRKKRKRIFNPKEELDRKRERYVK